MSGGRSTRSSSRGSGRTVAGVHRDRPDGFAAVMEDLEWGLLDPIIPPESQPEILDYEI